MGFQFSLNALSAVFMFVGAIAPAYFALKVNNRSLRALSVLLSVFLVLHGAYHLASLFAGEFFGVISDQILEPLSWLTLVFFAIYYGRRVG